MSGRFGDMAIEPAVSAEEAFNRLEKTSYDAIIVDYDIPGINGIQFLKLLRSRRDSTPVVFFTGAGREHTAIEALNNGASFYLKKGEDLPHQQYKQLAEMVKSAVEGNYLGRSVGTSRKIIEDMVRFMSDPGFAIDNEGAVIAWNEPLEQLTGTAASAVIGRRDLGYAEVFFGKRRKTLPDLVLAPDEEIKKQNYMLISRVKDGPVIAVTRGRKKDGSDWTIWTKAMPLFDGHGKFIGAVGAVRDVTTTFSDVVLKEAPAGGAAASQGAGAENERTAGLLDKILGTANASYKEGVVLMVRNQDYTGAIAAFDRAIQSDDKLPYVWNDRGICYREKGDYTAALKSSIRAVELAPEDVECLYTLGETLETIGLKNESNEYLQSAIQVFTMVGELLPGNIDVWNHLGTCHKAQGKHEESLVYYNRARDIRMKNRGVPIPHKRDEFL